MSPIGDLARQDEYLPDVGEPLLPSGPQFSPGLPVVNRMADILTTRPARDEASPVEYRTASPLVNITKQDIEDATNTAQAFSGGGLGIKAYHSSPHDFEKFDLSKIGTGEGAQMYGHGLYFAENPAVSGQGGQYWNQFQSRIRGPEGTAAEILKMNNFDREKAAQHISKLINYEIDKGAPSAGWLADRTKALQLLESDKPVGPRTYEVDINADPAHFLDWDKPLSQQSAAIQAVTPRKTEWGFEPKTGENAYKVLQYGAGSVEKNPAFASARLSEAGIPGIRYLDQQSRLFGNDAPMLIKDVRRRIAYADEIGASPAAKQKLADELAGYQNKLNSASNNYVVFNPGIIDILRKYGIAGAAPLGMGALAAQDNYQPQE